ncbi:MAG: GyrI-like domain-containing protein [Bacteroidetes bacterium]|nr:MAG: GyrI-like domain-containing protein [Bacteroidota bacterium]
MKDRVEIIDISDKILVGKKIKMSLTNDRTSVLWKNFKSQLFMIKNRADTNFYSIQIYNPDLNFKEFNSNTIFENWAAVEVIDHFEIPDGMEPLIIKEGKYAVFTHYGMAKMFLKQPGIFMESGYLNLNFNWMSVHIFKLWNLIIIRMTQMRKKLFGCL